MSSSSVNIVPGVVLFLSLFWFIAAGENYVIPNNETFIRKSIDTQKKLTKKLKEDEDFENVTKIVGKLENSSTQTGRSLENEITTFPFADNLSSSEDKSTNWTFTNTTTDLKYILIWTFDYWDTPFDIMMEGQMAFILNNCTFTNCYVTANRSLLGADITKFDAIAFHAIDIVRTNNYEVPESRSPHQKYIVFQMESSDRFPICNPIYDDFFNWTATYKLDSDIPIPYIQIRNKEGEVVGPKRNMEWKKDMNDVYEFVPKSKIKAAAWFVSNCASKNGRDVYVKKLQKALNSYGLNVDIIGKCGLFQCPKDNSEYCNRKLEREYFFYLSAENSFSEDYVTEKLLTAVQYNVVPIVYGTANYSWFLPPGSYLDANKLKPMKLAAIMSSLMNSPKLYRKYFSWKQHYSYQGSAADNVCAVCQALNNDTMLETHCSYREFRKWWNPHFEQRCCETREK